MWYTIGFKCNNLNFDLRFKDTNTEIMLRIINRMQYINRNKNVELICMKVAKNSYL